MYWGQVVKKIKKTILLSIAIIIALYTIICDILMTFSISMNCVLLTGSILCVFLYYMELNPLDLEERTPSFIRVFIKIFSLFYFFGISLLFLINILYPKYNLLSDSGESYDYIIVFGAGVSENKTDIINSRIDKAIEYSIMYPECRFVLTGAKGKGEMIEEAIYMRNYMLDRNVPDKNIIVDPFSVNTEENIKNSLLLIKKDIIKRNSKENIITRPFKNDDFHFDLDFLTIGFMSSEFHLSRINMMAKKMGISKPYNIACNTKTIYLPYQYIREDLSFFKALVLNQLKF